MKRLPLALSVLRGLALGFILAVVMVPAALVVLPPQSETPQKEDRAERLFREHRCWTDDGEQHPIPEGGLVTLPGDKPRLHPADVGFGIWLDGQPGTLHAFCAEGPRNLDTSHNEE